MAQIEKILDHTGRRRIERVRTRLTVEERGRLGRYETHWNFRTYDAAQVRRLLRAVPELDHVATYDFSYQGASPGALDGDRLDTVLILRRTEAGRSQRPGYSIRFRVRNVILLEA